MKNIAILGSTGSIGKTTLDIISQNRGVFNLYAISCNKNIFEISQQIVQFCPKIVVVFDEKKAKELKKNFPNQKILSGLKGLIEIATDPNVDFVLSSIMGSIGLVPTIEAIKANKVIGLANKEVLVAAGELVNKLLKEHKSIIIPVDSEHSAIFQALKGEKKENVKRIILTASGGPFLNFSTEMFKNITIEKALKHPNFSMGRKITIDSSTLMNKGFEVIEAFYLFNVDIEKIDVIIHKEQIIHSMVEFIDGSILAQMSTPTMKIPIQYALSYPDRILTDIDDFDFLKNNNLTFVKPDMEKFRCLKLAFEALKIGKSMPCFLNASNEILVEKFLNNKISWLEISKKLEKLMSLHEPKNMLCLEDVLEVDKLSRVLAGEV